MTSFEFVTSFVAVRGTARSAPRWRTARGHPSDAPAASRVRCGRGDGVLDRAQLRQVRRGGGPGEPWPLPGAELRRCSAITPGADPLRLRMPRPDRNLPPAAHFPERTARQPALLGYARPPHGRICRRAVTPGRHTCAAPAHHRGEGRPAAPSAQRLEHAGAAVMGDPLTRVKSGVSHHEGGSATSPPLAVGFRSEDSRPARSHVECHLTRAGHRAIEGPSQRRCGHESRGPAVPSTSCAVLGAPAAHTESSCRVALSMAFETLRPADLLLVSRHGHSSLSQFPGISSDRRVTTPVGCGASPRPGLCAATAMSVAVGDSLGWWSGRPRVVCEWGCHIFSRSGSSAARCGPPRVRVPARFAAG